MADHQQVPGPPPPPVPPPPGPPPGQPQYGYVEHGPTNGMAVAALVLGIVGAVFGLIPFTFFIAWICGVLAIVFGAVARGRVKRQPHIGRKTMATWGLVLGIVSVGLGGVGVAIVNDAFEDVDEELQQLQEELEEEGQ